MPMGYQIDNQSGLYFPVRAGWVNNASDWRYSSASDYEGERGLIEVTLLDAMYGAVTVCIKWILQYDGGM